PRSQAHARPQLVLHVMLHACAKFPHVSLELQQVLQRSSSAFVVPPAFELEINFGGWLPCERFCFLPFHALHLIEKETLSCTEKREEERELEEEEESLN
ncbi:Os03g0220300, partial [Oryza sativa Japonica Group]